MSIKTVIPFKEGKKIGTAYNEVCGALEFGEWVILMDYDVMIMNPMWQAICQNAIDKLGHVVGLFSCFTNRIGCRLQVAPPVAEMMPGDGNWDHLLTNNHDMLWHRRLAKELYKRNSGRLVDTTKASGRFSGMLMLTNKTVWEKVGHFKTDSFFHVDVDYYDKVKKAGYRTAIMADLYVYHMYMREVLQPFFTAPGEL
jgi:GT2 family glycosyltransferase